MLVGGALLAMPSASSLYAQGALGNMMQNMFGGGLNGGNGSVDCTQDADGDGIPNAQDPDYVRPQDGSGAGYGSGTAAGTGTGTGVCDGTGPKGSGPRR